MTGLASLLPRSTLPDHNDCQVLAAEIHGRADVIVTASLRDFLSVHMNPDACEARRPATIVEDLGQDIRDATSRPCRQPCRFTEQRRAIRGHAPTGSSTE